MLDQIDPTKQDEEIRLVDLLATVIRRRRWWLWSTIIGSASAILLTMVLPLLGVWLVGAPSYQIQATLRMGQLSPEVKELVGIDYTSLISTETSDLELIGEIYKATLANSEQAQYDNPRFNKLLRSFLANTLKTVIDPKSGTVTLSVKSSTATQENTVRFVTQLVARLKEKVRELALVTLQAVVQTPQQDGRSGRAALPSTNFQDIVMTLKSLFSNPDYPLTMVGSVVVLEQDPTISKGLLAVLIVLGSGFAGLLLAFGAEGVDRTRRDPVAMELLKKAWRRE